MKRDIIHVFSSLGRGGIETWLLYVLRTSEIIRERSIICLIGNNRPAQNGYDDEVAKMCVPVYHVPFSLMCFPFILRLIRLLRKTKPIFLHCHMNYLSGLATFTGRLARIPARIAHYHADYPEQHMTFFRKACIFLIRMIEFYTATQVIGCSYAALASYGISKREHRFKSRVLYYGIDLKPFRNSVDPATVRAELGIRFDAFVIGHIGRFAIQKNHTFLVDIAAEVAKREPKMRLLLVGDGPLRPLIEQKIVKLGLNERVIFAGIRPDVPRLMLGAMDVFLFPSLWEGLPVVLLEAQAAGLPCIISDVITEEADVVKPLVRRLSLSKPASEWAEAVMVARDAAKAVTQPEALAVIEKSPFNILNSVKELEAVYNV